MGLTSWATITTVTPWARLISEISPATAAWFGRSRLSSGSSSSSSSGSAHEGLGDQQPLLLAAGDLADGPVGVRGRADQLDDLLDPSASRCREAKTGAPGSGQAPAVAVAAEAHDVTPRTRRLGSKLRRWGR